VSPKPINPARRQTGLRERGKRARIERILDAGLALLREEPIDRITMERIALRADVSTMTVFNLIGNKEQLWVAMADHALIALDVQSISDPDPHTRASKIVDAVVRLLRSDPLVFRELLSKWSHGGSVLTHDPTRELADCLREAVARNPIDARSDARLLGDVLASGLIGTITLWTAGVLSDRAFGRRARSVVDVVFAAAKSG
jgi:AcrR family transcriptional regulator